MSKGQLPHSPDSDSGSFQPSYAGWEYQILASVWLTLEFILLKDSKSVTIEPVSNEDLSAEYEFQREVATIVTTEKFQVQIKLRNNVLWTTATFEGLFPEKTSGPKKRGPKPRPRPLSYLEKDRSLRFILVTNTGLDRDLRDFRILQIGDDSKASTFSKIIADPEVVRRVGILEGKNTELINLKIASLLQKVCHVPGQRLDQCVASLVSAIRKRLLGDDRNILSREDLDRIISSSGGSFEPRRPPIAPSNFDAIKAHLKDKNAILLIGPPGTGKTELALALADSLALGDPPADLYVVKGQADLPGLRRSLDEHGSTVYYLEDPWGQGPPDAGADYVTTELSKLLPLARAGKSFVITSTIAAFQEATEDDPKRFQKWVQFLNPDHYAASARSLIYERMIEKWPEEIREQAAWCKKAALENLETPFAIVRFCGLLQEELKDGTVSDSKARTLARESNVGAVTEKLTKRIARGGESHIKAAIIIWALLTTERNLVAVDTVRLTRRRLKEGGMQNPPDLEHFFNQLAVSWLQKRVQGFLATPTVRKALGSFSKTRPGLFEEAMEELATGWGTAGEFAQIHRCVSEIASATFVPPIFRPVFDRYLVELTNKADGYPFRHALYELAKFSAGSTPPVELARILTSRTLPPQVHYRPFNGPRWQPRGLTQVEASAIREDPDCRILCKKFVGNYLPHEGSRGFFGDTYDPFELVEFLKPFEWPIASWFDSAFRDSLSDPREGTPYLLRVLFAVTTESLDSIILDCLRAVRVFDQRATSTPAEVESRRKEEQGETNCRDDDGENPDWASHGSSFDALIIALEKKRQEAGYQWILDHLDVVQLLPAWSESAAKGSFSLEERVAIVECCDLNGLHERAASVVNIGRDPVFYDWAIRRLLRTEGEISQRMLPTILEFSRASDFLDRLKNAAGSRSRPIMALLAYAAPQSLAGKTMGEVATNFWVEGLSSLLSRFSDKELETIIACRLAQDDKTVPASMSLDLDFLEFLILRWPQHYGVSAAQVFGQCASWSIPRLDDFLRSVDKGIRRKAWKLCSSASELVGAGLQDEDCHCRIAAMERLAALVTPAEWGPILELRVDPSAFVRESLARLIGTYRLGAGIEVLLSLLGDDRDYGWHRDEEDHDIFKVAQVAAESLFALGELVGPFLPRIREFLESCEKSTVDPLVHARLFATIARFPTEDSMSFCCRYMNEVWAASGWSNRGGHSLLESCLDAVIFIMDRQPECVKWLDLSEIGVAATWRNDSGWLVAPITAAIGLGSESETVDLSSIVASGNFNENRARLLVSLSPSLRDDQTRLKEYLSSKDDFTEFLEWTNEVGDQNYEAFRIQFPNFDAWLTELSEGNAFDRYLIWAVTRLIASKTGENLPAAKFAGFHWI